MALSILVAPKKFRSGGGAASDNLENALDHTDASRVSVLETAFIVIAECDQTRNEHVAQELRRSGRAQVHDQVTNLDCTKILSSFENSNVCRDLREKGDFDRMKIMPIKECHQTSVLFLSEGTSIKPTFCIIMIYIHNLETHD